LVTAGARGAAYAISDCVGRIDAVSSGLPVVDTTGAGDAFTAGFVAEMLRVGGFGALSDPSVCEAVVRVAAACGALACSQQGAMQALPTRPELDAFLQTTNLTSKTNNHSQQSLRSQ